MFDYSLQRQDLAKIIRESVDDVLKSGYFTKDLSFDDFVSTSEMGDKVLERIKKAC